MKRWIALLLICLALPLPARAWDLVVPRQAYDAFQPVVLPEPARISMGDAWVRYTFEGDSFAYARLAPMDKSVATFERNLQGTFVASANTFYLDVPALYEDLTLSYRVEDFTKQQIDDALYALENSETRYWEGAKSVYIERVAYLFEKGLASASQAARAKALYERNHAVDAQDGAVLRLSDAGRSRLRWFAKPILREVSADQAASFERAAADKGMAVLAIYPLDVVSLKAAKGVEKALRMEKWDSPPEWPDFNVAYNIDGFVLSIEGDPRPTAALRMDEGGRVIPVDLEEVDGLTRVTLPDIGYVALCG